jgi:hypothetical protein
VDPTRTEKIYDNYKDTRKNKKPLSKQWKKAQNSRVRIVSGKKRNQVLGKEHSSKSKPKEVVELGGGHISSADDEDEQVRSGAGNLSMEEGQYQINIQMKPLLFGH